MTCLDFFLKMQSHIFSFHNHLLHIFLARMESYKDSFGVVSIFFLSIELLHENIAAKNSRIHKERIIISGFCESLK